ncbi:hypothetical protein Barb6XT_00741 [Bacteroidales bacterium Barb6XT]|nr:hypothetical protein Barb6XT_00741 [Bacteroidales bacterium Barb6XT]
MFVQASRRDVRFQPHMQRSGMWGHKDDTIKGVLKERPNNIYYTVNHHLYLYRPFRALFEMYSSKPHIPLRSMWG